MKLMETCELIARKISVRLRLVLVFTLILAAVTGLMGYYATQVMSEHITSTAQQSLKSQLALTKYLIDINYPGDWKLADGKLYKGDILIEGNYAIIDRIGELTKDNVTIFRGDTRGPPMFEGRSKSCGDPGSRRGDRTGNQPGAAV